MRTDDDSWTDLLLLLPAGTLAASVPGTNDFTAASGLRAGNNVLWDVSQF